MRGAAANDTAAAPASSAGKPAADATGSYQPDVAAALPTSRPGPSFDLRLAGDASESYVTNAYGVGGAQRSDYLSSLRLNTDLHEHSRRVDLDANYSGTVDFYAQNTVPTQVSNYLQALGSIDAIPDYLLVSARAFAQPVLISDFGAVTAGNRVIPGNFRNSYGYSLSPVLTFHLGDFATSQTLPSFGQAFFTLPEGSSDPLGLTGRFGVPGLLGPQDTTMRSIMERISSGPAFNRLNWSLVGSLSETDRGPSLLSEKAGVATLSYAVSYEFSLLATGGYDSVHYTTGLFKDVSGPVALGGFSLTLGENFAMKIQAGTKYNSISLNGNIRYNITPTSAFVASADDYVQTPEGQLLNNLTNLTALNDGSLASSQNVLGNGSAASLSSYNIQSTGNLSLDQNISRYQTASLSYMKDYERQHISLGFFATRRTILGGLFFANPTSNYWGLNFQAAHDFTPLLTGTIGGTYTLTDEYGSKAKIYQFQGEADYRLSRETSVYLRSIYLGRDSSGPLTFLSPLAGNVSDLRVTVGLTHEFF